MAVHKEHTLRSFPSFPEPENFEDDDDDYDNNFIISLEDNGDEDEDLSHIAPICTSVPFTSNSTNQNGEISSSISLPYQIGADRTSTVSTLGCSSDAYYRDTSTYSQSQVTRPTNSSQLELQPGLYSSSKESLQCSYQHSLSGSLFYYPSNYPRSNSECGINDEKKITVTKSCSSNINGTTAISKSTDSCQSISGNMPACFVHSENQNHEHQSIKSNVSLQNPSTAYSELPKMHLETIHLDKEAGGIWSEAVFLKTTEVSDSSFADFGINSAEGTNLPVPNNGIVPKLSGPYFKTSSPHIGTNCSQNVHTGSTVDNLCERVLKTQVLNGNVSCNCVMCYKGKVNVEGFQKSQNEDPHLTNNEKLFMFKKPAKRNKLTASAIDSEKDKAPSQNVNFEITYPQVSAMLVNNAMKTQSILSYVNKPVTSAYNQTIQSGLSTSSIASKKIIMVGMGKNYTSGNTLSAHKIIATEGAKMSLLPCELPKTATVPTNVSLAVAVTPTTSHKISIPRLSSYPTTKVFLKPSEVPGQKSQAVSSALELISGNTLTLSSHGQPSSGQTKVSCKETPSTYVSASASLTSPSSKVIYVSSDQVFLYPNQARTPVSIISVNKQPQTKASNASHITVIQLPSGNSPKKKLPADSTFQTCHQSVLNQNPHLYSINTSVNRVDTAKTLRHILSDADKGDISGPRTLILKPKLPVSNLVTQTGHMHTSQVISAVGVTDVSPVSTGAVHMISLLKASPQARGVVSSAPIHFSDANSVNTKPGYLTSKVHPPPGLGTPQTLLRLVTPVQERPSVNSDKTVNLFKAGLQTLQSCILNSSVQNAQVSRNGIPGTIRHTLIMKPTDKLAYKSPPERDKPAQTGMLSSLNKVSSPHLPQEGLPSTYIEDWVNKAKTFVSEQLKETDCIQDPHSFTTPFSDHNKASLSSQDAPKEYAPLNSAEIGNINSPTLETPSGIETALSKQETQSQLLLRSPTYADIPKRNELQVLPSDSSCMPVSLNSSVNMASTGSNGILEQLDQSSTLHRTREKVPVPSILRRKSQAVAASTQKLPYPETGGQTSVKSRDTPGWQLCKSPTEICPSPQSSSSILDSSKGIKLKIKLGILRNDIAKHKQSNDLVESNVRNSENMSVSQCTGEVYSKESVSMNADISGCDNDKQIHNPDISDRTETAEEMFQRFQEQAVQEVFKAQMGMGYVSRSLRPTRTTMAFLDKYPYKFGPGRPKKKDLNEKSVSVVSEKSGDSNHCTSERDHEDENSGINKQHKKLNVRHKRQAEEAVDKEVKIKQPKLSIKDYPRLKQDYSLTDCKTVYCTNILAGHKVFVKFNTFENMNSERAFLVPFFNIGGSRTQFDVEDMEYINKAVMDFESEERSCARHLLFYSRAGNKAIFLRKETNLQASHINDKNYRKCCFVLEGYRRNTKKQTETSPEHWKVDNTVDIEIDRAEIDNDMEIEFDSNICLDEVTDELGITAESAEGRTSQGTVKYSNHKGVETADLGINASVQSPSLPVQDKHSGSIKTSAYFVSVNESELVNTKCDIQIGNDSISKRQRFEATVPVTSEFSGSVVYSDQTLTCANKLQGSVGDFQSENLDRSHVEHVLHPNICTAVKEEVLIGENDAPCPFGHIFNPAWIKKEKLDGNDEDSINQFDSDHPSCDISSVNSSPHPDRHVPDEYIIIKNEPVDNYFDSLEETEQCYQIEASQHVSKIPVRQQKPIDQVVNFTPEEIITSNAIADAPDFESPAIHSQCNDFHQDQITEQSTTASCTQITRQQLVDGIVPIHARASKINSLIPLLTSTDIDNSTRGLDDPASVKTSVTGPSLPESPLPSSSMSCSSEILASSDVDDIFISSESNCSNISHASMHITEITSEDEDNANKQNIVQNKIASLVESLRHRLTQDTSSLPPWIASINKSATETKAKTRKMLKINLKKKIAQHNTPPAQPQVSGNICSSATETASVSRTISAVSSPVLSSVSYSAHRVTTLLHSPSTRATPSLPSDTLPSVVTSTISTMNLSTTDPKQNNSLIENVAHQPFVKCIVASSICNTSKSDYLSVAECASDDMICEEVSSEAEDIIEIDDDSFNRKCAVKTEAWPKSVAGTYKSDFVCASELSNKLSNGHFQAGLLDTDYTACSEAPNPNRQSPVDFEIEIGNEDLPETALSLQLILPKEDLNIEALKLSRRKHIREYGHSLQHPVDLLGEDTSSLSELQKCRTMHSKEKTSLVNTQPYVSDNHTDERQAFVKSETKQEGSVASYLCQKFSFHGKSHNIKGPRLLHMPSSRRASFKEASKQKSPMQTTFNPPVHAEPITTEELLKTPSLDEIFGASLGKELMANPEIKLDSVANSASPLSVNSNSISRETMTPLHTSRAQVSKKKKQNRKERENSRLLLDISHSNATEFQPSIVLSVIKPSFPNLISPSVNKTESDSEVVSKMNVCKVVLTKLEQLELSYLDRLSENVFIIRNEAAVKERPSVTGTKIDSDNNSQVNHSKSTFKRIVKKKKRKITRPGFRRKGDVIDYYAYMLETLQKKAQQLEEETRKKEAEEFAKKMQLESSRCEEVKELKQSTDVNERDEIVAMIEETNNQGTNKEVEEVKEDGSKEECSKQVEVDCLSETLENIVSSLEATINAVSADSKDEPASGSVLDHIPSEKTKDSDASDCVCLSDNADSPRKEQEAGVSDSDWPYLQKFCDETIFNQGNIDCLQKINKDICFPGISEGNCELKFGKKDIVLCSNVNDGAVLGELGTCETLSNTEDTDSCIQQCADEQEKDEDEIFLGLKIKNSSEFSCDDQETKLTFSQRPIDVHVGSRDDENYTNGKLGSISSDENISSAITAKEHSQTVPVSCQIESTDPAPDTLKGTSDSWTASNQSLAEQNITVKTEKPQRTLDISPSWERLLGHKSINISGQLGDDISTSHPETSQNHDVSFVASSNFKLKFKLPKGILSKALQMSRDIKNMLEEPASDDTLLNNSEITPRKSLDEAFKNNANPHDNYKLPENEDSSVFVATQPFENKKAHPTSQMPVSKLKFSSETLNAIHKAKAEFLQKRTNEKRSGEGLKFENHCENITNTSGEEQAHRVDVLSACGNENTLTHHRESSDDNYKKFLSDSFSCSNGQENNELSTLFLGGVSLNEESRSACSKPVSSNNAHCKQTDVKSGVQAEDSRVSVSRMSGVGNVAEDSSVSESVPHVCNVAEDSSVSESQMSGVGNVAEDSSVSKSVSHVGNMAEDSSVSESVSGIDIMTTDNTHPSMFLKQSRKDGIFSNPDLFQGCDNDDTPKRATEPSSNKELQANIDKINVIDIRKLKLKLNPVLSSKLKENTEKSLTASRPGPGISSELMETIAQRSFHKLQLKLNPHILAKQKVADLNVCTSQKMEESTSVAQTMLPHNGPESVALLDSQVNNSESGHSSNVNNSESGYSSNVNKSESDHLSNVVKMSEHVSDKLNTNITDQHPVTSSSEMSVSTCRQFSQLNTAKLCTILKNFHKTGSTPSLTPTNPGGTLLDSSLGTIVGNKDDVDTGRPKLRRSWKSNELSSAANNSVTEAGAKYKTRGKRRRCQYVSEKHEAISNTDTRRAKRTRHQISTTSCVTVTPTEPLSEGQDGSVCNNEQLDSEDKSVRSFFDCLSSVPVPLDAWE